MSRRKALSIIALFLLFTVGCFYFAVTLYLPSVAQKHILANLESFGFEDISFARATQHEGQTVLKNVHLDKNGFSKIDSVILEYKPLDLLFKHRFDTVSLRKIDLTGEMDLQGNLLVAGWNPLDFPHMGADNIIVENGSIDILWTGVGGVNLRYDLKFNGTDTGANILGTLNGRQKQVSFESTVSGHVSNDGSWSANLDISNGKIDIEHIKASRITGQAELFGIGYSAPDSLVQLSSGNVTLFGLPWQNVSAAIDGLPGMATTLIEGKSSSTPDADLIEFSASIRTADQEHKMGIHLHGPSTETIQNYMKTNGLLLSKETDPPSVLWLSNDWRLQFHGKSYLIYTGENKIMGRLHFEESAN